MSNWSGFVNEMNHHSNILNTIINYVRSKQKTQEKKMDTIKNGEYRQRIFLMKDLSIKNVLGMENEPKEFLKCLVDHWVEEHTIVKDYAEYLAELQPPVVATEPDPVPPAA